jgi:hypothetical protein
MLAHQPADLLGVHHKAAMTKLSVNTPIAISFELVANRLHLRNDGRIVRACVAPIVRSRARNPISRHPSAMETPPGRQRRM